MSPNFQRLRRDLAARDAERRSLCNAEVEPESVLLPFGKHRGRSLGWIAEHDLRYLDWLKGTWLGDIQSPSLRSAVEAVWKMHEREITDLVSGEEE